MEGDRIIKDGFPDGWFVQDRLDEGTALLCAPCWPFGTTCLCLRPCEISTDDWLPTAKMIAKAAVEHQERAVRATTQKTEDA